MKCVNRSLFGVIIGAINICFFAILIIWSIAFICHVDNLSAEDIHLNTELFTTSRTLLYVILVVCIVSLITSVFLVLGIIKQRHTLMQPWIYSAVIGMVSYIFRIITSIAVGLPAGESFGSVVAELVIILGLQLLIFYPIYTLYTDFRDAASALEQQSLNNGPQSPPNYGELEKGGEMYN